MAGKARAAKPGAAGHAAPGGGPPEVLRGYYRQMTLVRAFELRAVQMYTEARIAGTATSTSVSRPRWSG